MDFHIYIVSFGFIIILSFIFKMISEISISRKRIEQISRDNDEFIDLIISLKKEINEIKIDGKK